MAGIVTRLAAEHGVLRGLVLGLALACAAPVNAASVHAAARIASPVASIARRKVQQADFSPGVQGLLWAGQPFDLSGGGVVYFDEREVARQGERSLEAHAKVFAAELSLLTARPFRVASLKEPAGDDPRIELVFREGIGDLAESEEDELHDYRVEVTDKRIVISGTYVKSVACGTSTLLQAVRQGPPDVHVPGMVIEDFPVSAFRSVMIDVARNPHSIEVLEDVIRLARQARMRYVHLHLTDDQHFTFPFAPVVDKLENNFSYDRERLVGLVDYAAARGITLIPEIDLPGHSSRLRQSGYLKGAESDRDVADARYEKEMATLLGDVMDVFHTSPYFHIGGDESGAGEELLPFLARVQKLVRKRGKRLIVWEGFHGAPTEILPPTGPEHVIVASWESSYNAPWDLLKAGYMLINASWRPTYVVGGDSRIHPGSTAGRKWAPEEIAIWHKNRFMHWEPGRAVYEDRGPDDDNLDDGIWDVKDKLWQMQIRGGQMCVWEQKESSVIRDLRLRLPVLSDRLWSGPLSEPAEVLRRARAVDRRVFGLVQPVAVELANQVKGSRINLLFDAYEGETAELRFQPRLPGVHSIRYVHRPYSATYGWIDFPVVAGDVDGMTEVLTLTEGGASGATVEFAEGGVVVAAALDKSGQPLGGATWKRFQSWPARVHVTEYEVGRRALDSVPDFDALPASARLGTFTMPMLRGPLDHARVKGQRHGATLVVDQGGAYTLGAKTQSGRASLSIDLNGDGVFAEDEALIRDTPRSEELQTVQVELEAGRAYALRVDHVTALPRPVLIVTLEGPATARGDEKHRAEITPWLVPLSAAGSAEAGKR